MNSDTQAPSGMSFALDAELEGVGREDVRHVARAAVGQDAHDVEVGEGHDQGEQHGDGDDVAQHRQGHVPHPLQRVGAVDGRGLVELLGHRLEGGEVHDDEEGRPVPDVDQDDREPGPVGVAEPGHRAGAEGRQQPVDGAVGRVEQPPPAERAHRRRDDPGDEQHPAPHPLALADTLWTRWATMKPISALKITAVTAKMHRLLAPPSRTSRGRTGTEVPEADEARHRLVQRGEVQGVEGRVDHQAHDRARSAAGTSGRRCVERRRVRVPVRMRGRRAAGMPATAVAWAMIAPSACRAGRRPEPRATADRLRCAGSPRARTRPRRPPCRSYRRSACTSAIILVMVAWV